jgi:hypothetical protein
LSLQPRLLEGFQLNNDTPTFDSIVRSPLQYTLDRATRSAHVVIPKLVRGINFFPGNNYARYSIVVTLGIVPDVVFNPGSGQYEAPEWHRDNTIAQEVSTEWKAALEGSDSTSLDIAIRDVPGDAAWTLMLSVGIRFGAYYQGDIIKQVKRTGAAKIVAMRGQEDDGFLPDDDIRTDSFGDSTSENAILESGLIVKSEVASGHRSYQIMQTKGSQETPVRKAAAPAFWPQVQPILRAVAVESAPGHPGTSYLDPSQNDVRTSTLRAADDVLLRKSILDTLERLRHSEKHILKHALSFYWSLQNRTQT